MGKGISAADVRNSRVVHCVRGIKMKVRVRFLSEFDDQVVSDVMTDTKEGSVLSELIVKVSRRNQEGYNSIFDKDGNIKDFVVLTRNGRHIDLREAGKTIVEDGDDITVFPPISGG